MRTCSSLRVEQRQLRRVGDGLPDARIPPVSGTSSATRLRRVSCGMPGWTSVRRRCGAATGPVAGGGGPRGTTVEQAASSQRAPAARASQPCREACPLRYVPRLCHDVLMPCPPEARLDPGLYIVATPIGNLGDLSPRAADMLSRADVDRGGGQPRHRRAAPPHRRQAADDRRITITMPNTSAPAWSRGWRREAVALVSDAGTPLISDPGYKLVRDARAAGHTVVTIPGPCAAVAALTLAGLPTDRFLFLGFLPSKARRRADAIAEVAAIRATLVLYESGPRLPPASPRWPRASATATRR